MRELKFPTYMRCRQHSFQVRCGVEVKRCILQMNYRRYNDGIIWAFSHRLCEYAELSTEYLTERERFKRERPLVNGEHVLIDGLRYAVRVIGHYADCAVFDPV